jgi:outer membrane protein TolC
MPLGSRVARILIPGGGREASRYFEIGRELPPPAASDRIESIPPFLHLTGIELSINPLKFVKNHTLFAVLAAIISGTGIPGQAQTSGHSAGPGTPGLSERRLSLAEALSIAGSGNFDLRIAGYEKDQADADFRKSASVFLPQVHLSETFVLTDDPLAVFGFKLKEERVTQADFNPALLNDPPDFRNFTTKVEVQQPLLNFDGFFGRHAASKAAAAAGAKENRARYGTELGVKNAYFGLALALRSLGVVSAALEAATTYRAQAKDFLDRGMVRQSDYLMADVRVLELEMKQIEAQSAIRDAGGMLRTMLGLPDSVTIVPTDTLALIRAGDLAYDPEQVFAERSDLRAMKYGVEAASAALWMQRAGWLPSLNAFASYELNNDRLTGTRGRNWMVGAMLRWTIFGGFDRIGEIQKASAKRSALETQYEKMKADGGRELASAMRALDGARKRVELSQRAVDQAAESFRVLSDRYEAGLERTPDLLQAEATLLNARLASLQAIYQHNSAIFMIEFLLERKVTS